MKPVPVPRDEMQAIVGATHQLGMKVAVHAYTPNAIADAVKAGADSIEHGFFVDDATLKLMKQQGTFLVPTLAAAYPPPFLGIKDPPSARIAPGASTPPTLWYIGKQSYKRSVGRASSMPANQ